MAGELVEEVVNTLLPLETTEAASQKGHRVCCLIVDWKLIDS